jgi:hypothetical protein
VSGAGSSPWLPPRASRSRPGCAPHLTKLACWMRWLCSWAGCAGGELAVVSRPRPLDPDLVDGEAKRQAQRDRLSGRKRRLTAGVVVSVGGVHHPGRRRAVPAGPARRSNATSSVYGRRSRRSRGGWPSRPRTRSAPGTVGRDGVGCRATRPRAERFDKQRRQPAPAGRAGPGHGRARRRTGACRGRREAAGQGPPQPDRGGAHPGRVPPAVGVAPLADRGQRLRR